MGVLNILRFLGSGELLKDFGIWGSSNMRATFIINRYEERSFVSLLLPPIYITEKSSLSIDFIVSKVKL